MSKNQLALITPEIQAVFPPEVLDVIRTSLCPTATDAEFVLFAHKAASYGLDPFKNEIFFIKYGNQARIQFAAEAYLAKAREKEGFQPPDTQMVCENDEFMIGKNPETKELEVKVHDMPKNRGKIVGGYSVAYRDGYRPVLVYMDLSQVEHMFTGQNKDNWNKWTTDMFGKHLEQRALKKQYGLDLNEGELPQGADAIPEYKPSERKDITEEANAAGEASQSPPKQTTQKPNNSDSKAEPPAEESNEQEMRRLLKQIKPKLDELGIPSTKGEEQQAARLEYYTSIGAKFKDPDAPTIVELNSLLKLLDQQIEMKQFTADDMLPE